jgi:hypothetical protein
MSSPKRPLLTYTRVVPGSHLVTRGVYIYECPACRKLFRFDDPYEPVCTGPSENRDDHSPTVMKLLRKEPALLFSRGNSNPHPSGS